jgi:hypothetical protein
MLFIFVESNLIPCNLIPLTGEIILLIMRLTNMEKTGMAVDQTRDIGDLKIMEVL